ncbi:MAG TPA: hypothetical protein DDY98_03235 [Ruminococcaceae bacterium]|nr:hypothetical protein [Oscillospiraceae bacterium]
MFGYVKAYKPELKCKDYDIYQGVYCSVCRQLGHDYGVLARFVLNYDFTLLALVRLGVVEECCGFEKGHCSFNPTKKCMKCVNGQTHLSFAAAAAILMCYYKISDNLSDEKNPFKRLLLWLIKPYFAVKRKKAKKKFAQIDLILSEAMAQQKQTEQTGAGVDASAHPSATAMGRLLALDMPQEKQEALQRFGYLVGRWVYLADALDDCDKDRVSGNYNVFNRKFEKEEEKKEYAAGTIRLTAAESGKCFESLQPKRFGAILENILQFGMEETLKKVLKKGEKKNEKSV